jgi:hypothetical protein
VLEECRQYSTKQLRLAEPMTMICYASSASANMREITATAITFPALIPYNLTDYVTAVDILLSDIAKWSAHARPLGL